MQQECENQGFCGRVLFIDREGSIDVSAGLVWKNAEAVHDQGLGLFATWLKASKLFRRYYAKFNISCKITDIVCIKALLIPDDLQVVGLRSVGLRDGLYGFLWGGNLL